MDSRQAILSRIRTSLKATGGDGERAAVVANRLVERPQGIIPKRGQLPADERLALFIAMAEKYNATTERLATSGSVPAAVAEYLKQRNLPASIRIGGDPRLTSLSWQTAGTLEVRSGASDGNDLVAVSHAFGGIAETGTICVLSGPDNPVTLNFLPDHHIVVVEAAAIVGDMESLWANLRKAQGETMPRTVNMITGPSRSADIEQTLLLGAHGPQALHIVIVGTTA
ncbi:MAG: lactate utilization protein [Alphaproteobacteria bacterium]|nr:lactate utilization protein [Alphaproteobacteria bacterium]MBU0831340.1 lactate utilization protein [Alphaproteobacteria bacterium]MBU1765455.1 lactate utilization protein [Alphaproteobacteria bacterium]